MNLLGKKILEYCSKENITKKEFAEKIGIGSAALGYIVNDGGFPTMGNFIKMLNIMNVSADEVLRDRLETGNIQLLTGTFRKLCEMEALNKLSERDLDIIFGILHAYTDHPQEAE